MRWTMREIGISSLLTLVLLVVVLGGLEIALSIRRPAPVQRDALLGWRLKPDFHRVFHQKTLGGREYPVSFTTDGHGFRVFGSNARAPVRILVLGDSFTADPYASNARMWYVKMAERLAEHAGRPLRDYYVLAGGAGGWGTYQYLLLSQHSPAPVRPNLFVLQFCSNDFQNNSYELESQGVVRGQYMRRPFAGAGLEGPNYAPGLLAGLYRSFAGESHLLNRLDGLIGAMQYKSYGGYIRPMAPQEKAAQEQRAVLVTSKLLARLRDQYRDIPAVMVNCDGSTAGPNRHWTSIAREAGFIPVSAPSDFLRALKPGVRDKLLNADGSHLSEDGNQAYGAIAGDAIAALQLPSPR